MLKKILLISGGGVFARKVYDRNKDISQADMSLSVKEQTTFELVPNPDK